MEVRVEIKKVANDDPGCAYLVGVRAAVGIAGTIFPYMAMGVRDQKEALGIAGEILAPTPRGQVSVIGIPTPCGSSSPANSNEISAKAGVNERCVRGVGPRDER